MSVVTALKAEHRHVLLVIVRVLGEQAVPLLLRERVFLAVGRLVARLSAVVAPDPGHRLLIDPHCLGRLVDGCLVLPVLVVWEVGEDLQGGFGVGDDPLNVDERAIGPLGAEAQRVVYADLLGLVRDDELACDVALVEGHLALLAEAALVVWALLLAHQLPGHPAGRLGSAAARLHMQVCALVPLLALLVFHEVATRWDLVLVVYVEELALVSLLALILHPMDANGLLDLALVLLRHLAVVNGL